MLVQVPAGGVGYFILNQLEEGSFVTSPIITAGASATRAADIPQLTGQAASAALAAHAAFFQTSGVEGTTGNNRLLDINPSSVVYGSATNIATTNGTNSASVAFGSGTYTGVVKAAAGFDSVSMTSIANGGSKAIAAFAWNPGASAYIGNLSIGTRALNGYMQRFALSPTKGAFDNATSP
jgi:hypothetical protein